MGGVGTCQGICPVMSQDRFLDCYLECKFADCLQIAGISFVFEGETVPSTHKLKLHSTFLNQGLIYDCLNTRLRSTAPVPASKEAFNPASSEAFS